MVAEAHSRADRLRSLYDEHGDKLRFLVVGGLNTAIGYVAFIVMLAVLGEVLKPLAGSPNEVLARVGRAYYLVVQWVTWVLMVPVSTTTIKYLVFRSPGNWVVQSLRGYVIYLPAQGLSSLILFLAVKVAHLSPQAGQLLAIGFSAVMSYLGHKYFTFRVPLEVGEVPDRSLLE